MRSFLFIACCASIGYAIVHSTELFAANGNSSRIEGTQGIRVNQEQDDTPDRDAELQGTAELKELTEAARKIGLDGLWIVTRVEIDGERPKSQLRQHDVVAIVPGRDERGPIRSAGLGGNSIRTIYLSHIKTTNSENKVTFGEMDIHVGATAWRTVNKKLVALNATTMKGLFELKRHHSQSTKDVLRFCYSRPELPRPKNFNNENGSRLTLVELKRFVVDETDAVADLKKGGAVVYQDRQGGWVSGLVFPAGFDGRIASRTIPKLSKLKSVVSYFSDDDLVESLTSQPTIRQLRFGCEISPKQIRTLTSNLNHLNTLGVFCPTLSKEHCLAIQISTSIHLLELGNNRDGLVNLSILSSMRIGSLRLTQCNLDREATGRIVEHLSQVSGLEITDCTLTNDALAPLQQLDRLYTFTLRGNQVRDKHLQAIQGHQNLAILNVSNTAISNDSVAFVIDKLPKVFSMRAESVELNPNVLGILARIAPERQFRLTVSDSAISRRVVESAGEAVARRINVNGR